MDQWYCRIGEQDYGPFAFEQIIQAAENGQLPPQAWIRYGTQPPVLAHSMPQLMAIYQRKGIFTPPPVHATAKKVAQPVAVPVPTPPVPLGAPVAVSAPVPVRVAAPVVPAGIPVGLAAPPVAVRPVAVPPPGPWAGTPAPVAVGSTSPSAPPAAKKKKQDLTMVIALAATAGVVAVVGLVVFLNSGKPKPKPDDVAATGTETAPTTSATESNPDSELTATPPGSGAGEKGAVTPVSSAKKPLPSAKPVDPVAEAFSKTKMWNDFSKYRAFTLGKTVKVEIQRIWLAANERGEGVGAATAEAPAPREEDAAEEKTSDDPPAERPAPAAAEPATAKYVFVQLQITNVGAESLKYRSWNGPAAETQALLADGKQTPLAFVPPARTPAVQRVDAAVDMTPKKSLVDVVVFAAPADTSEGVYLLLPRAAFVGLGAGHSAWRAPEIAIAAGPGGAESKPVSKGPVATTGNPALPADPAEMKPEEDMPAGDKPLTEKPIAKPAANGDQPPSIDDLNKQIRELNMKDKPADKPAEKPADAPEPAKPNPEKPADDK